MGFGRKLDNKIHAEWKEGYLCYRIAKLYLKSFRLAKQYILKFSNKKEKGSKTNTISESSFIGKKGIILSEEQINLLQTLNEFEENFSMFFYNEITKIEIFLNVHIITYIKHLF